MGTLHPSTTTTNTTASPQPSSSASSTLSSADECPSPSALAMLQSPRPTAPEHPDDKEDTTTSLADTSPLLTRIPVWGKQAPIATACLRLMATMLHTQATATAPDAPPTSPRVTRNFAFSPIAFYQCMYALLVASPPDSETHMVLKRLMAGTSPEHTRDEILEMLKHIFDATNDADTFQSSSILIAQSLDKPEFLAALAAIDFTVKPEKPTDALVNNWVANATNGKVCSVFPKPLTENTQAVLANVTQFKGMWKTKFKESNTSKQPFVLADDTTTVQVDMMHLKNETMPVWITDAFTAVFLPYQAPTPATTQDGAQAPLEACILLPKEDRTIHDSLLALLDGIGAKKDLIEVDDIAVDLHLPKFDIKDFRLDLLNELPVLRDAITKPNADFTAASTNPVVAQYLDVNQFVSAVSIKADERGTEATAVVAVEMVTRGLPMARPKPKQIRFDRPFIFSVLEPVWLQPVFLAVVADPSA